MKSLKELASLVGNALWGATPVGQAYNATQKAVPIIQQGISSFAQNNPQASRIISKAEPAYNKMQSFVRNIPDQPFQYHANTPYKPVNSLLDLGSSIFLAPLNAPTTAFKAAHEFPQAKNKQQAIGSAAKLVNAAMAGSIPKSASSVVGKVANQPAYMTAKQKLLESVKEGAKAGSQYGAFGGAMNGLEQGSNLTDPAEYVRNLLMNTGTGAVAGAGIGAAGGVVGSIGKQTVDAIQGKARTMAKEMTKSLLTGNPKAMPKWTKGLSQQQIEEKLFGYYKSQLGQSGAIDFSADVNKKMVGRSANVENGLREITSSATSAQDMANKIDSYVNEYSKQADKKQLADLRAGLVKEITNITGGTGDYKKDYAVRVALRGDTEVGPLITKLESHISNIDDTLSRVTLPNTHKSNLTTANDGAKTAGIGGEATTLPVDPFVAEMEAQVGKTPINIKPKKPLEMIAGSDADQMIAKAQLAAEGNKKGFQKIFSEFIGKKDASSTRGVVQGIKIKNVPANPVEVIKAIENPQGNHSPEVKKYIEQFRKLDDEVFNKAKELGLDIAYRENHIAHLWNRPQPQVEQMYQVFKQKYGLANERIIPTYEEGIKMGLEPKYNNPSQILAESVKKLEEVKAGIEAFTKLKDQGFIVPASVGMRRADFAPIQATGFPKNASRVNKDLGTLGNWYAPKEIADQINRVFSSQDYGPIGSILEKGKNLSGFVQDIGLSGGVPKTPMNAFGAAQILKESLAGRPVQAVSSFIRSFSDNASKKYFENNSGQIIKMQERNIPISSSFNIKNLAGGTMDEVKGMVSKAFNKDVKGSLGNLKNIWDSTMNEPTFQKFMPQLQVSLFNDIEKAALKNGKDANSAADIAAQAVKNFYGTTGSDVRAAQQGVQNPLVQDFLGTFTFAPKFRESMINFWVNNAKALKNPLSLENRTNTAFVGGAIATYIGMDRLNYALNGRHMSENPQGTEDKLLVPVGGGDVIGVPFLSSIATIPRALYREGKMLIKGDISSAARDAGQTFTSMMIKPIADVIANSDYFGNEIAKDDMDSKEKYQAQAKYLISQYTSHPYLKELTNPSNQGDPAYQRLSRSMELPFRFYTEASLASKTYFAARDKALSSMNDKEQSAFNSIPKADTNDPNTRILKYQIYLTYPKVFEAKQKIELETAAKTNRAIDPLYLVDYETAKKYMRYEALPEGSQDRKAMTKAYPELVAMFGIRSKYFNENPLPNQQASKKPVASAAVQAAMDRKDWNAAGVKEYLDANTQWNNQQREKLGLPPTSSGFAQYKKKVTAKKITPKKFSISLPKKTKIQNIKVSSAPKPKKASRKAIKITAGKPIKFTKIKGLSKGIKLA